MWIKRITEVFCFLNLCAPYLLLKYFFILFFQDVNQASFYLKIYGLLQVFSLILAPVAGAIMDFEVNKASKESDVYLKKLKMAKAGFWPIFLTNISLVGVIISKFYDHEIAIYISIVLNTFLRSFLIAVASAYLRIR